MENIILLGLGGHAHSVVDSIEQAGEYNIIGFWKQKKCRENVLGIIRFWVWIIIFRNTLTEEYGVHS